MRYNAALVRGWIICLKNFVYDVNIGCSNFLNLFYRPKICMEIGSGSGICSTFLAKEVGHQMYTV